MDGFRIGLNGSEKIAADIGNGTDPRLARIWLNKAIVPKLVNYCGFNIRRIDECPVARRRRGHDNPLALVHGNARTLRDERFEKLFRRIRYLCISSNPN